MASGFQGSLIGSVRRLYGEGTVTALSETQLLDRFLSKGDEAAFEAIVQRHGPMVLGVCRRVLDDPHDVDDAFQATFLVLVKKARSIRDRDVLAVWLYGVARRVAVRCRVTARRRKVRERPCGESVDMADFREKSPDINELRKVLDSELERLPARYRAVIVLCDLEGQTQEQAATQLHCPVGTVKSRLVRGREQLRARLVRRGFTPTVGMLGALLASEAASAVPVELMNLTIGAATGFAAGGVVAAGTCLAKAIALVEGVQRSMTFSKIKLVSAALLVVGMALGSARLLRGQGPAQPLANEPATERIPDGAVRFKLKNGLNVFLRPIQGAKNVALVVSYSIGNDHDPEGKSGLAHMLEHLYATAAAGDEKARTAEEYSRRYPDGGNAQTGDRYTVIASEFPEKELASELKDAAARMSNLRITDAEVDRERERITEELENMYSLFLPLAAMNNARELARPLAKGGRRGGADDSIKKLTTVEIQAYWARYYKPCNAILSISGALDPAAARKQIETLFGNLPAGERAPKPQDPGKPRFGMRRAFVVASGDRDDKPIGSLGYVAPQPSSELYAPFLILVSRLWEAADKLGSGGVTGSPVYYTPLDDGGVIVVSVSAKDGDAATETYARLEAFVAETLAPKLGGNEARDATEQLSAFLGTKEIPDSMLAMNPYLVAFSLARREQLGMNPAKLKRALESVTDADLRRVVKEVFAPERHTAAFVSPQK